MNKPEYGIAVTRGDGIGVEVIEEGIKDRPLRWVPFTDGWRLNW